MSNPLPAAMQRGKCSVCGMEFNVLDDGQKHAYMMGHLVNWTVVWATPPAHAAAELAAARACMTCRHHRVEDRHIQTRGHVLCVDQLCTNADRYDALPPVRLWRTSK